MRRLARLFPDRDSLLFRLIVRLTATTFFLTVAVILVLLVQLQLHVDTLRDRSLVGQARDIARHLSIGPDGAPRLRLPDDLAGAYAWPDSGYYFLVRDADGNTVFSSAGGALPLERERMSGAEKPYLFQIDSPAALRIYGAGIEVAAGGRAFRILVAQTERHADVLIDELLEEFFQQVWWVLPAILVVFLAVNLTTIKLTLKNVEEVSAMATAIGPSDRNPTLPVQGLPSEILPLVEAVNTAFGRLAQALRVQRDFTADAAHELRTPLAVLSANLDLVEDSSARAALRRDVRNMSRIVNQLLQVAQLDAVEFAPREDVDLRTVAAAVAADMGPLALERGMYIELERPEAPVVVKGDVILLRHALTNLVENALSHSPVGATVTVTVDAAARLHVDDRGSGVPEAERPLVFQRFWRKDRNSEGAGIGLSIVERIAGLHGGSVAVADAPGGGARFTISLGHRA